MKNISKISVIAFAALSLSSCSSDPDSPGYEYMPDMYRSSAIEPYVDYGHIREREHKEYKTKMSAKTPPFATIPYYGTDKKEVELMLPYHRKPNKSFKITHGLKGYEFSNEDEYALALSDDNPLVLTEENKEQIFEDGKKLFNSKCAHCHGKKGDGNGTMVESGAYAGVPDYANLKHLSDGQIFYSIYYGKGMMGAHASILTKKEIWTLVHQVRKFQDPNYGSLKPLEESLTTDTTTVDLDNKK